ncbi:hypothetical protein [Bradyrhizobium sp. NP1]|jgi:hypothetical protein|uniref:hypothetical protein n=1 Tax=Bradyrhizobium sp. NP1 TaxID=3049772 RepID=UPI0025A658AF|nr:hypothetical protein [Bradyrhizobium sp. NP1]WJR76542.1 hypothetical protein QOU61_27825 [Bradyrhizobium sp. NP1]
MSAEFDYDLTPDQWEALKALRAPQPAGRAAIRQLVSLKLATVIDERPVITATGRKVLVRGSSKLLDLVA